MKTRYNKITLIEQGLGFERKPDVEYIDDGGAIYEIHREGEHNTILMMEALDAARRMTGKTIEATITEK